MEGNNKEQKSMKWNKDKKGQLTMPKVASLKISTKSIKPYLNWSRKKGKNAN